MKTMTKKPSFLGKVTISAFAQLTPPIADNSGGQNRSVLALFLYTALLLLLILIWAPSAQAQDTDGDGVLDLVDLDDDNDGILDIDECGPSGLTATEPFTSLNMARNVTNAGLYFFDLGGQTFSTYVDASGYVQVAIDFGNGVGNLPQGTSLTNSTRGILDAASLAALSNINEIRISHSGNALDVVSTNATLISRVMSNTSLHRGLVDNAINNTWTGTGAGFMTVNATCNTTTPNSLNSNIVHVCGAGGGTDWIPNIDFQRYNFAAGEIGSAEFLSLWVRARATALEDIDGDGILNCLDLDSDNDGCPDSLEGATGFTYADTVDGIGGTDASLGDNVGANAGTDLGIPTLAGTGQGDVSSKDASVQASACLGGEITECDINSDNSFFYNADFEQRSGCPSGFSTDAFSQLDYLDNWDQTTNGTSDYLNTCGFYANDYGHDTLLPFPGGQGDDGNTGAVAFVTNESRPWFEYLGQCLKQPVLAGTTYTISFYAGVGTGFLVTQVNQLWGADYIGEFQLLGVDGSKSNCPTPRTGVLTGRDYKGDKAGFTVLATSSSINMTPGDWKTVTMTFTPTADFQYVLLGNNTGIISPQVSQYTVLDNLTLGEYCPQKLYDYGDAPTLTGIKTLDIDNGAKHLLSNYDDTAKTSVVMLGTSLDDEDEGKPSLAASLDAYDDAVTEFQAYQGPGGMTCSGVNGTYTTRARQYCVTVKVTNNDIVPAQLVGWLDYDMNQSFTDNERSLADLGGNGTSVFVADADGNPADSSYSTGNIPAGFSGDVVLVFSGLGLRAQPSFQSYARFRLTSAGSGSGLGFFSNSSAPSPNGAVANGEVEDYFIPAGTLPVTLSSFDSAQTGKRLEIDWGTASELFNSGFQLWGLDKATQQWSVLNKWLVASGGGNSVEPQSYTKRIRIPKSIKELESLGISSVDSNGKEHFYGPFEVGKRYGELTHLDPIDWSDVRAQADASMAAQGYTRVYGKGYKKLASTDSVNMVQFSVATDGLYKLSAQDILLSGADWTDIPKGEIAILNSAGNPIARHIIAKGSGKGKAKTLGAGGHIVFYANSVDQVQGLYSGEAVYRLVRDASKSRRVQVQGKQGLDGGYSTSYTEQSWTEQQNQYLFNSVLPDPWMSAVVLSYPDKMRGAIYSVALEADALRDQPMELIIRAGRSSAQKAVDADNDGVQDPEHILQGVVASPSSATGYVLFEAQTAVGAGAWETRFLIPEDIELPTTGVINAGAAMSAGAGYAFSEIYVDAVGVSYSRPYVPKAGDSHLNFTAPNQDDSGYRVQVPLIGSSVSVYASDGMNLVKIRPESVEKTRTASGERVKWISFAALQGAAQLSSTPIQYWVTNNDGYLNVSNLHATHITPQTELLNAASGSDYLIISHPAFMGESLTGFANHKRSLGHTVSVVDYLEVVNSFAGGQSGPQGLTDYLAAVEKQSGGALANVLLVGGSTYDHRNYLGSDAITFIPSPYGQSVASRHTPSDSLYVQDANGAQFASIGRWPGRTMADIDKLIAATTQWDTQAIEEPSVLLIAEQTKVDENIDFGLALDGLSSNLPADYVQTKIYSTDELSASQAKPLIKAALNDAPQLVLYNGHGSTSQLSTRNLYNATDAVDNQASSSALWLPMSCYMTYYESTSVNTLAHQLLFSGQSVAISGASLLSSQGGNIQMGEAILGSLNSDQSLGASIDSAKAAMNNPATSINWSLLGDPSIGLQ